MIKTGAWGHHGCFLGGEGDLGRGMVAFLGLGGGEGGGDGPLGCCRKRTRSRRGPQVVEVAVAETGEAEGVVGEVEVEEKGDEKDGAACEKACVDCGSTKTPLWRGGPAGPKTLCNACGIRCRKMRRKGSNGNSSSAPAVDSDRGRVLRMEGEEKVMRQRQRRKQEGLWLLLQQSRKFRSVCGEEEADAAVLLMALSTGLFLH